MAKSKLKKVLVAFSGGLDTSFCVTYLKHEKNMEVHTALVDTGGFSQQELKDIAKKAKALGSVSHKNIDVRQLFYRDCLRYLIFGNVLRNNTYPLSVSAERVFQSIAIAHYANAMHADAIAHGSTGAGNDQIRFDVAFSILAPDVQIITPIRDLKISRQDEIAFLQKHGVDVDWKKASYSINKGIWGTSIGGVETLTSDKALPTEAYPSQLKELKSKRISIQFQEGEITGINHKKTNAVRAIEQLNELGSSYAIGRDTHVGDTILGIKGRVGFEAPAALMIIKAHHLLEKHTLTKWQQYWKEQLSNFYGMLLHEALFFDPVMKDIQVFLENTQQRVSGTVFLHLHPYRFELEGIESKWDMMKSKSGQYGEMNNAWTGDDARGFIKIMSNYLHIYHSMK